MEKIKCITLYPEVYSNKDITFSEKVYLSVIRYYTIEGRTHCCKFSDKEMAEELEMDIKFIRKIKCNLKKLNLITVTDDGIIYNKITSSKEETPLPNSNNPLPYSNNPLPNSNNPLPYSNQKFYKYIENQQVARVNKENKEENKKNKDNKPEEEFETNFDFLFSKVREDFRTEENKTYLLSFKDKIDYFNSLSRKDLNEGIGYIVNSLNSLLSEKNSLEAIKNNQKNKERDLIEKKKESGLFEY